MKDSLHPDRLVDANRPARSSGWLVALLLLAVAAAVWFVLRPHGEIGEPLTNLVFEPLVYTEQPITSQDLAGKVAVINFWGPWCPPCLQELPEMLELESQYRNSDRVAVVLVSCANGGDPLPVLREDTVAALRKRNSQSPNYHDDSDRCKRDLVMAVKLDGFAFPTTVVLGPDGAIVRLWQGYRPKQGAEIADIIEQQVAKLPAKSR